MDLTQMLKGLLPLVALAMFEDGDAYGYEVLRRLRTNGLDEVGDASVYGTLQRLYETGLLSSYLVKSDVGPSRKYYAVTTAGRDALKDGRERWQVFEQSVSRLLRPAVGGL
jgi:PadR family transcriptional regulator PadR